MAYDEELADRIRDTVKRRRNITERKMFGGVAFMLKGNMAVGVIKSDIMVRVGPDAYEQALGERHVREMDFTGKPLRGYVYVGGKAIETDDDLSGWVDRGLAFARTLPAKKK